MITMAALYLVASDGVKAVTAQATGNDSSIFDYITPILSTGVVGVFLLMILFRVKIMPVYVYEDAKTQWDRERVDLQGDVAELKQALKEANEVYTKDVIPTLTRVLDAERELVELRREQTRQR